MATKKTATASKTTARKAVTKGTKAVVAKATKPAAPKATKAATTKVDKGPSKVDLALAIFTKHYGDKSRKEIQELFQTQVGLTKAGSQTYYQNFKSKADAIGKRAAA